MTLYFVFGTRPEITKSAGIARSLAQSHGVDIVGICTGQQTDLVKETIRDLRLNEFIPMEWCGSSTLPGRDSEWIRKTRESIPRIFRQERVDAIVGTGDTNSVLECAKIARKCEIPFIHLEAGIRHAQPQQNLEPEETNRRSISSYSSFHLCPSAVQRANLLREGVSNSTSVVLGELSSTAVSEVWNVRRARIAKGDADTDLWSIAGSSQICVCTFHRSTSLEHLDALIAAFNELIGYFASVQFFLCSRPDTRWRRFYDSLKGAPNITLLPALNPTAFQKLLTTANVVVTDSAGVQQEALLFGKPVIALRNNIELFLGDPNLYTVNTPFFNLIREFSNALSSAERLQDLGLGHVQQSGSLITERGARLINRFIYHV